MADLKLFLEGHNRRTLITSQIKTQNQQSIYFKIQFGKMK